MTYIQRPAKASPFGTKFYASPDISLFREDIIEDQRPFSTLYHETEIHVPIEIMSVSDDPGYSSRIPDCLDMPIRLQGSSEYALPQEWEKLLPSLKNIINIEHTVNPNWEEYYTYLSVHYSPNLIAGEQQRHAGCHTDGFQGVRVAERTKTSRSYVAVTNGGTRYFPQTFVANLDASRFNIFEGFDLQVEKDINGNPSYQIAEEKKFYFFDAYAVHESGAAERDGDRLFVRLTWEKKLFDRAENTINTLLDYNWAPEPYDIRSDLITPTLEDINAARLT